MKKEKKTQKISRRYRDFVTLIISKMIVKRFEAGEKPFTAEELSKNNQIPIRLVTNALHLLTEIGLLFEIYTSTDKEKAYQPAIDIHQLTVAMLFDKMESYGSESFKIDEDEKFKADWQRLIDIKRKRAKIGADVLIKDL